MKVPKLLSVFRQTCIHGCICLTSKCLLLRVKQTGRFINVSTDSKQNIINNHLNSVIAAGVLFFRFSGEGRQAYVRAIGGRGGGNNAFRSRITRTCLHSPEKHKTITPFLQAASLALPTECGLLLYLSYSFLSGHTAPQRYDSLDDHRPSPFDPRYGGQRTGRDQQTNGRPRGGRISRGR